MEIMKHETKTGHLYGKATRKSMGLAYKLGGAGSQVISRVGQTVLAWLMETQIKCLPAGSVWGELSKKTMPSASTSA